MNFNAMIYFISMVYIIFRFPSNSIKITPNMNAGLRPAR